MFVFPQKVQLLENEYKCLLKINRDPAFNKSGTDAVWSNSLYTVSCCDYEQFAIMFVTALPLLQDHTAVVPGMAGCAGTTLRREPTPFKTALIILSTLTPRVRRKPQDCCSFACF